jgi:tetratricopeptide (TPR) repeat protein
MSEHCQRYSALSDQAALGEPLEQDQERFMARHGASCRACRAEAGVWSGLGEALENPQRLTDAFPLADPSPRTPVGLGTAQRRGSRWLMWGASVVAAVAAGAVWISTHASSTRTSAAASGVIGAAPAKAIAAPQLALVAGTTSVNGQPARGGRRLALGDDMEVASGRACLLVPPGVTVCAAEGSRLKVEELDPTSRRLRLLAGHAVARLQAQPAGSSFGFETSAGSIVAKGTVFSLQAFDDQVALRVHEGTVVQRRAENVAGFAAPAAVLLSRSAPAARPADELWSADLPLLNVAKHFTDGATGDLEVTSRTMGLVSLDDTELGHTPLSALLTPGSYLLGLEQAGRAPVVERLTVSNGARLVRNYETRADERATAASRPASKASEPPSSGSPAELLAEARTLRQNGRFHEAATSYTRLLREYPTSSEARAATVSLGELQLSQLGDAKSALRSFDAYLRKPGALSQEASYGRIRALQRLGRTEDVVRAIEAYLTAYPKSPQAATLRKETR